MYLNANVHHIYLLIRRPYKPHKPLRSIEKTCKPSKICPTMAKRTRRRHPVTKTRNTLSRASDEGRGYNDDRRFVNVEKCMPYGVENSPWTLNNIRGKWALLCCPVRTKESTHKGGAEVT